jgi:hypothetical protein
LLLHSVTDGTRIAEVVALPEGVTLATEVVNCSICGQPIALENCKTDEDGKGVHEVRDVAKLTLQNTQPSAPPPAETSRFPQPEDREHLNMLVELIVKEKDPTKFRNLVQELSDLLDRKPAA